LEKRGAPYDANGRLQGLGASGSDSDTQSKNLFIKVGHSFGENTASASH